MRCASSSAPNCVLRWTPSGYEIEADPRHAEILIAALGDKVRPVVTPGIKETATAKRGSVRPAEEENATEFSTRVSAKTAKVEDLHRQIRDLAAQLDKQQGTGGKAVAAPPTQPRHPCLLWPSAKQR